MKYELEKENTSRPHYDDWWRGSTYAPFEPVPLLTKSEPLRPGEVVPVDIPLGPSATLFRPGEQLLLVVAGRRLWPRNPRTGQFPAAYEQRSRGICTLHWGPQQRARLIVPVIP